MGKRISFAERFWEKVEIAKPDICWLWKAKKNNKGYGMFRVSTLDGFRLAHRTAFEMCFGDIKPDMSICHKCDNPECVNPYHMFEATHAENMHDKMQKGRDRYKPLRGDDHPYRKGKAPKGERHSRALLTNAQAKQIRILAAAGEQNKQLAEKFNVSRSVIKRIKSNRTYIGVP